MKTKVVIAMMCGILAISSTTACGGAKETVAEVATTAETIEESEEDVKAAEEAAAKEAEKEEAYETGRACLYGLDGQKVDLETAYNSFEKALELGKTEANFYLGVMYDWESYPEQDYEKARAYYEAAGENPYAYVALGFNYYYGQGVAVDQEKGKEYFDKAIALGCMDGYFGLGEIAYEQGDYTAAIQNYEMAAEKGTELLYITNAERIIANSYLIGVGVEQDCAKAVEWYEKAAEMGDTDSMATLGYAYANGDKGLEQDYIKAAEWLEKAAEKGNTYAMSGIGYMYQNGLGVETDYAKAVEWYEKGAEMGDTDSMTYLGYAYANGDKGLEQDYIKAAEWLEKAAEKGNTYAMSGIGYMYQNGLGVETDYAKALEWYEKAAEMGDATAMYNIGHIYENGLGVDQDAEKAAEWYAKAEEAAEN